MDFGKIIVTKDSNRNIVALKEMKFLKPNNEEWKRFRMNEPEWLKVRVKQYL